MTNTDKLLQDLKTIVDDAQAMVKETLDVSAEQLGEMPAYLEERLHTAKTNLQQAKRSLELLAKDATVATCRYAEDNPWKAIGVVAAASLLVGLLVMNACRSCKTPGK